MQDCNCFSRFSRNQENFSEYSDNQNAPKEVNDKNDTDSQKKDACSAKSTSDHKKINHNREVFFAQNDETVTSPTSKGK